METVIEIFIFALVYFAAEEWYEKSRTKRVLIVEDSVPEQFVYQVLLKFNKVKFVYCDSAEDALKYFHRFRKPDAVVTDYHLPKRNGDSIFSLCYKNDIPVVMVTADTHIDGVPDDLLIHKRGSAETVKQIVNWLKQNQIIQA